MGWRGRCLALGLVRGAVRHYCLGGCSALSVCARRSRPVWGGRPGVGVISSPFPPPRPECPALCVAGRPVRVLLVLARWYAIPCGLCVPRARSGCPSGIPRVSLVCVCARALGVRAPPPLPWLVWRAHFARSGCRALVGPFHSFRAPGPSLPLLPCPCPCFLPRFHAPFVLFCFFFFVCSLGGGAARFRFPPTWLGAVRPPWGGPARPGRSRAGRWGGGVGAACVPFPRSVRPGGQWGWGSPCLGPSLCLSWAGNKAGVLDVALAMEGVAPIPFRFVLACRLRARSVWRPCAQARVRLSIAVPAGAGGWGAEVGPAPASLPGAAVLPGGGGITATASGGVGAGVPVACG